MNEVNQCLKIYEFQFLKYRQHLWNTATCVECSKMCVTSRLVKLAILNEAKVGGMVPVSWNESDVCGMESTGMNKLFAVVSPRLKG